MFSAHFLTELGSKVTERAVPGQLRRQDMKLSSRRGGLQGVGNKWTGFCAALRAYLSQELNVKPVGPDLHFSGLHSEPEQQRIGSNWLWLCQVQGSFRKAVGGECN